MCPRIGWLGSCVPGLVGWVHDVSPGLVGWVHVSPGLVSWVRDATRDWSAGFKCPRIGRLGSCVPGIEKEEEEEQKSEKNNGLRRNDEG